MVSESLCDLARARPHAHPDARFTPPEWRAYCQGYYAALAVALPVLDLAFVRFRSRVRTLQAAAKRAKVG